MSDLERVVARRASDNMAGLFERVEHLEALETPFRRIATFASAPPSIGPLAYAVISVTVPGAQDGDLVLASHTGMGTNDLVISGHVQAVNTVRVILKNESGVNTAVVPAGTLKVLVTR